MISSQLLFMLSIPRTPAQLHQIFVKRSYLWPTALSPGAERGGQRRREGGEEASSALQGLTLLVGNRPTTEMEAQAKSMGKRGWRAYAEGGVRMIFSGSRTWVGGSRLAVERLKGGASWVVGLCWWSSIEHVPGLADDPRNQRDSRGQIPAVSGFPENR